MAKRLLDVVLPRKQDPEPVNHTVPVRGLVFSDLDRVPIIVSQFNISRYSYRLIGVLKQKHSTDFEFPLRDSPILPDGTPKSKSKLYSIKRTISSVISPDSNIQEGEGSRRADRRTEYIHANTQVRHFWGPRWNQRRFVRSIFNRTDIIAICFDRSKPETLHSAIYKVCVVRYTVS
jgi:hypothetical protein